LQKKSTNRTFALLGVLVLFTGLLSMLLGSCGSSSQPSIVAWVNGIPIEEGEMQRAMNENRSLVLNYFYEQYGVEDSSEFWYGTYGGEVPVDLLKQKALEMLIQYKVERGLAYEAKLIQSLDYKSFLTDWRQENKRRKQTVAENGVIYGPVAFSEAQYFQYSHSKLMIELKEAWAKSQQIQEERLIAQYEKTKEERYRKPDRFQLEVITLPWNKDNRESLLLDMKTMMEAWNNGSGSLQTLSKFYKAYYEQFTYTRGEDYVEASHPAVWEAIHGLKPGESSEIIDERSAWVWFYVKDRQAGDYEKFAKLKEVVKNHYIEEQFNLMIGEKVRLADIQINEEGYEALTV
jgi:hypothetical protein